MLLTLEIYYMDNITNVVLYRTTQLLVRYEEINAKYERPS